VNLQRMPPVIQSQASVPPSCVSIIPRIMRVPKPARVGSSPVAWPPLSSQTISMADASGGMRQTRRSRPSGWESAPYFAAFVASSCNVMDKAWMAPGASTTRGPSIATLRPVPTR
jgi:hypothetical protein